MQVSASTQELLQFERLVSALSSAFINMPAPNIDAAIADALQRIVEALRVDRSTLSLVVGDGDWLQTYHSWAVDGVTPVPRGVLPLALPWALARAREGLPIVFSRLEDLPREATIERAWYGRHGLRSHVGLPVIVAGELVAILGFGTVRSERRWSSELLDRLKVVAEIFGSALARKRAHEDVQRALGFERLLVDISAAFFKGRPRDINDSIRSALRGIGEFMEVERAILWTLQDDRLRFVPTHASTATFSTQSSTSAEEVLMSSRFEAIVQGSIVFGSSADGLTKSRSVAEGDAMPVDSILAVPLMSDEVVVGVLSLWTAREPRTWEHALIPRVRLIGEVFASLINRQRAAREIHQAQSETAQYRERLAHLVRVHTVDEMSAAIAHEVNQPLMAIENYAQAGVQRLARDEVADGEKLHALFTKISAQSTRAGSVLKRLRSIVKKHESEESRFDLGALVVDTMNLVEMESRLKDVQIQISLPPGLPWVFADEIQIQQVLVNLARNGVDAMDGVPIPDKILRIEVIATRVGELTVRVRDNGRGISERDAKHLFEPFYTTKQQGLGIGLVICRSIIEAHGGRLAHSPDNIRGTVFEFTLPALPANR